jgi:4-coumarate--CoA ligase
MPYQSRWSVSVPMIDIPSFIFTSPTASLSEVPVFVDCKHLDTHYLTLNTFREWSKRIAAGLVAAGLKPGDRVLLWSGNTIFFPAVVLGVIMAGGIFTSANPSFTPRELTHQLRDAEVHFLLAAEAYVDSALEGARLAGLSQD